MKKAKKQFRLVTESGRLLINETYTERGANTIWENLNGVYIDDNGNEERLYIEEVTA